MAVADWRSLQAREGVDLRIAVADPHPDELPLAEMFDLAAHEMGLKAEITTIAVEPKEFAECIKHLESAGFNGVSVGSSLKAHAARLAERFFVSPQAVGSANTLRLEGGIWGRNTEVSGIVKVLEDVPPSTALVLGSGHAARSVVAALLQSGWKVRIWNRNAIRSRPLKAAMLRWGEVQLLPHANPSGCRLIVNATSLGLKAGEHPPVVWDSSVRGTVALDLVYRRVATEFLREASRRGFRTIDGRELLAEQAAQSMEWWLGREVPREPMRRALGLRA